MISSTMQKSLNDQINAEMYSSYLYLSMSAYLETTGLAGFAGWMKSQAQEELFHAMKLFGYVHERGGRVILSAIDTPPGEWKSPLDIAESVLAHEEKVSGLINGLVDQALAEKDHATNAMLQWFITEQVEEEMTASDIVNKLKLIADSPNALFMIDQELGKRVFTMPAESAG